jgi:hypothetical protein
MLDGGTADSLCSRACMIHVPSDMARILTFFRYSNVLFGEWYKPQTCSWALLTFKDDESSAPNIQSISVDLYLASCFA